MISFYPSIELDTALRVKIGHLQGIREKLPFSKVVEDPSKSLSFMGSASPTSLYVEIQVFGNANPICLPVRTTYKPPPPPHRASAVKSHQWNEWVELPILISQLPRDSLLLLTVRGPSGKSRSQIYCGCVTPLFASNGTLHQGRQKLQVELDTDSKFLLRQALDNVRNPEKASEENAIGELDRLEKLMQAHQTGQIPSIEWLDNLVFRRIENLNSANCMNIKQQNHFLFIETPLWDHDIVWMPRKYSSSSKSVVFSNSQQLSTSVSLFTQAGDCDFVLGQQTAAPVKTLKSLNDNTNLRTNGKINSHVMLRSDDEPEDVAEEDQIIAVYDPDFEMETPIEAKYRRLVRLSTTYRDMRPTAKVRDELERIITYSPVHELSSDDKILLWKYRYHLTKRKNALTKFVKSVSWDDEIEAKQAIEVLQLWADIDVADALELLGPEVKNAQVRAYAVDRLRTAADHDLELYLLQLVEALKFEPWVGSPIKSYLARFLENRAVLNAALGNFFYWYVSVQSMDRHYGASVYQPILRHYLASLPHGSLQSQQNQSQSSTGTPVASSTQQESVTLKQVKAQVKFMNKLLELAKVVKTSKETRPRKVQQMRAWIADPRNELVKFSGVRLPLDPLVTVVGCEAEECTIFKSSMLPLKIVLKTSTGDLYPLIFKIGDDLRQDQLVMQIIQLMDQLLRKENLDLKLSPYRILATSMTDGAIQFVPNSETLAHILGQHHGILPFLRLHAADESSPLGVRADVMDNFVRSAAGYAVITYLLGVGDRHLDNLLIDHDGHFFHIDFGYILGKDPKPFPPMIKLPIQLIDGMGDINSENYMRFRSYCFTAFTTLRKSANLILALFNLMTESTIPNILLEREQAVHKVEERFCLEMSEEEAILHFQNLINDSVNAFLPMVIDRLHSLAQYWRA